MYHVKSPFMWCLIDHIPSKMRLATCIVQDMYCMMYISQSTSLTNVRFINSITQSVNKGKQQFDYIIC